MTPKDEWQRIQDLCADLESLSSAGREHELAKIEPGLAEEIRRLFAAMEQEEAAQQSLHRDLLRLAPPPVELHGLHGLEPIGSGGSGVVYRATRTVNRIQQPVAVKVFHAHRPDAEDLRRFTREQEIMTTLNHPGIVHFLDAGLTEDERPYLVMELAEGRHITTYCDEWRLSVEHRIRLMIEVCHAVAAAHARLIVHLDLKPSNILVTKDGNIKVLDFGTAKLLDPSKDSTATQQLTPQYASPERLRFEPASVSSDVYSLGLVLFELLSGGWPFPDRDSIVAIADRVAGAGEMQSPAEASPQGAAEARGVSSNRLRSLLGGDLACICSRALAFESTQRYATVAELGEDLKRYLAHEAVAAKPATAVYRATRFVRRHTIGVAATVLFVLGLSGATAFSIWQARIARKQAQRAERINTFMNEMLGAANPAWPNPLKNRGAGVTLLNVVDEMSSRIGAQLGDDPKVEARLRRLLGRMYGVLGKHAESRLQLEEALKRQRQTAGPMDADLGATYAELSYEDYLSMRSKEGLEHAKAALNILSKTGRPQDKRALLVAYDVLGMNIFGSGGPLREAEEAIRRSAAISQELFGFSDLTVGIMGSLASVTIQMGKLRDAEAVIQDVRNYYRIHPEEPDSLVPATLARDMGIICLERKDYQCARDRLSEAVGMLQSAAGEGSMYTLNAKISLSLATGLLGHPREAFAELEKLSNRLSAIGGSTVWSQILAIDTARGRIHMAMNEPRSAEPWLRRAYSNALEHYNGRPATDVLASRLAECLLAVGKIDEARPLLRGSYERLLAAIGRDEIWTDDAKARLGRFPETPQ